MLKKKQTVYVGLSGGVDSSVSAALLKDQGYKVVGVYIRTWQPDFIECTWRDERRDAMRVAAHLDIPFRELDLESEYKKYVADYMIEEYRKGRTPNPDIMCNREIKFGAFKKWALKEGADFIATGHYSQIKKEKLKIKNGEQKTKYKLQISKDKEKDQTYFLWTLTQDDLKYVLFPVGAMTKTQVRKLAEKYKLPTAMKKDSQGVCMLGDLDVKDFLAHYIDLKEGSVLSESGEVIGTHPGSLLFTLGERHGFTITNKKYIGKTYYITAKDIKKNTLTVSKTMESSKIALGKKEITLTNINSISGESIIGKKIKARSRYRAKLGSCIVLSQTDTEMVVSFDDPDHTASPGQSLVLYDSDSCLGGGIIK